MRGAEAMCDEQRLLTSDGTPQRGMVMADRGKNRLRMITGELFERW